MSQPVYATCDPYLASFVHSQGASLVEAERLSPKKVEFRFIAGPELHAMLRLYWRRVQVLLIPAELFDSHRELKNLRRARP